MTRLIDADAPKKEKRWVHVSKCPCKRRATPTIGFYKDGKPQIYCFGWRTYATDEPIAECKNCADWLFGEQCKKDFAECKSEHESRGAL